MRDLIAAMRENILDGNHNVVKKEKAKIRDSRILKGEVYLENCMVLVHRNNIAYILRYLCLNKCWQSSMHDVIFTF